MWPLILIGLGGYVAYELTRDKRAPYVPKYGRPEHVSKAYLKKRKAELRRKKRK